MTKQRKTSKHAKHGDLRENHQNLALDLPQDNAVMKGQMHVVKVEVSKF